MAYTLQQTINWAQTMVQYLPLTAGLGQEPAVSTASFIRSTIFSAPFTWAFNRKEDSSISLVQGTQDYTWSVTNFGFLEKASIVDAQNNVQELKYVHNLSPLSASTMQQRPSEIAVLTRTTGSVKLRVVGVPDQAYTLNLTYQMLPAIFGPFLISSVANEIAGDTTYTGVFDVDALAAGGFASVTGFTNAANNGTFLIVSVNATTLVLANAGGVAETHTAYVSNFSWSPIPDNYNYIYNTLFLGEMLSLAGEPNAQQYRQRGMASLLAKAEGLTETQKDVFMQQWLARGIEETSTNIRLQQRVQAGAI
jgi:hypothetical protein